MFPIMESDLYKYLALATMLLAILFGFLKGRHAGSESSQSLAWTRVPLIALAIASLGPSAFAIMIYLGYKSGLLQPGPSGYRFSSFIQQLPLDFAVMNWPFVALFVTCRLRSNLDSARSAMWGSVIAMALPNVLLFSTAWDMVSNVFDAGQGIGIIQAMLTLPIAALIWSNPFPGISEIVFGIVSAVTSPLPILGLAGWFVGGLIGCPGSKPERKAPMRP